MDDVKLVKTLADLTLPDDGTVEVRRKNGQALLIPIRAISGDLQEEIERKARPPAPPRKMRMEGGRPTGEWYNDENDPVYLSQMEEKQYELKRDMILAGVAIEDLNAETYKTFLSGIVVGDIETILMAINDLSNVGDFTDEVKKSSTPGSAAKTKASA